MTSLFLILFSVLRTISFSNAIVNGTFTSPFANPHVVRLLILNEPSAGNSLSNEDLNSKSRCSGVAISDRVVLTAGHCLIDADNVKQSSIILAREKEDGDFEFIQSFEFHTTFRNSFLKMNQDRVSKKQGPSDSKNLNPVPGCSPGVKPLFTTQTPDLGTVTFPPGTFKTWSQIHENAQLKIGDKISYFGFGTHLSSYVYNRPITKMTPQDLRIGTNEIVRLNEQRVAWISPPNQNFADSGDSGAPVYFLGKVVAIISTISEFCETEFGEDYGILNTATRL